MKKIRMNPILKKEMKLGARSIKFPLGVALYSAILSFISWVMLASSSISYNYTPYSSTTYSLFGGSNGSVNFEILTASFLTLVYIQLAIICIIIPILTASSIAGERERQTLDIMLTSPITPLQIVIGKLAASLAHVLFFVIGSLPAMSLCFLYGGIQWHYLFYFIIGIMVIAFFAGAVGVWCSSVFKKSIVSVIMTLIIQAAFYLIPLIVGIAVNAVIFSMYYNNDGITVREINLGILPLFLLIDPVLGFVAMISASCSGSQIVDYLIPVASFDHVHVSKIVEKIMPVWGWSGLIVTFLLGVFFVWLAARQIDSVRRKGKRMKKRSA